MWSFIKLMIWGLIWLMTWPCVMLYRYVGKKPRLDNCFTWAIREWDSKPEGYLVIRWCRSSKTNIKWPHFLYLDQENHEALRHFMPLKDDQSMKYFPNAFFEGKLQRGDPIETLEN